jgi:hypothetical protein
MNVPGAVAGPPCVVETWGERDTMPPSRKRARASSSTAANAKVTTTLERSGEADKLRTNLTELWREGALCDVEIAIAGSSFSAHRVVLAAESLYMRGRFAGHFADSVSPRVELSEVEAADFQAAIEFMYTGRFSFAEERLPPVLELACRLQIPALQEAAERAIQDLMDPSSCVDVMLLAERLTLPALADAASVLALEHFGSTEVVGHSHFTQLPLARFRGLLHDDRLVAKEVMVFDAAVRWLAAQTPAAPDETERELLEQIRFPVIDKKAMAEKVEVHPLVKKHADIALSALREALSGEQTPRTQLRLCDRRWAFSHRLKGTHVDVSPDGMEVSHPLPTEYNGTRSAVFGDVSFDHGRHRWSIRCNEDPEGFTAWGVVEDGADPEAFFGDCEQFYAIRRNIFTARRVDSQVRRLALQSVDPGDVIDFDLDMNAGVLLLRVRDKMDEYEPVATGLAGKRMRPMVQVYGQGSRSTLLPLPDK